MRLVDSQSPFRPTPPQTLKHTHTHRFMGLQAHIYSAVTYDSLSAHNL